MTAIRNDIDDLDLEHARAQVDRTLDAFLRDKQRTTRQRHLPPEIVDTLRTFVFGGAKRLRPQLCVAGWHAGGAGPDTPPAVFETAAAIELCHTSILVHDDIIDHSDTRRGQPTVHRALAHHHRTRAKADTLGIHAAVLLGDLAMVWADELLHRAPFAPDRSATVLSMFDTMRADVTYGQYLDLLTAGRPTPDLDRAVEIIEYKTTSYTFEGPLRIGAALAGASPQAHDALTAYARPLGIAIQLRNDLLDTYGKPSGTIEPSLSDLREGKLTPLLAIALAHADSEEAHRLRQVIGNPNLHGTQADECRRILDRTARGEIETMIRARWAEARHALHHSPFTPRVVRALEQIAESVGLGTVYDTERTATPTPTHQTKR